VDELVTTSDRRSDFPFWIFERNMWNGGIEEAPHKLQGFFLLLLPLLPPSRATIAEICTRWMRNHQVPSLAQHRQDISLDMQPWALRMNEVAGPCFVSALRKCIADNA